MAKTTTATSWEVIGRDATGAMVNIDFVCPYCGTNTGELISVGADKVNALDGPWASERECGYCGKTVTVECY